MSQLKMDAYKNLTEGTFVKLTGMNVKNDNDIFVVDSDYRIEGKYGICADERCLKKVKLNGELKTSGYTIVFLNNKTIQSNPNINIEVVTNLKKAKKEVKDFLNDVTAQEIIVTYEVSEKQNIEKGSILRFKKGLSFGMFGNKYISEDSIFVVAGCEKTLWVQRLGKQGQVLSLTDPHNSYNFAERLYKLVIEENYIEVVEKIETKKGDIVKEDSKKINKTEIEKQQVIETVQENQNIININEYKEEKEEELNNMSILDKFENIEIENTDRVSPEDKEYCEDQERIYINAIELYNRFLNDTLELHQQSNIIGEKYSYTRNNHHYKADTAITYGSFSTNEIKDKINKMKNRFIYEVCDNFQQKYNITINYEKIQSKYKDLDVNYNLILDEVFEELGGFTFNEKAEQEIKQALKEKTRKWNSEKSDRVTVNKTKITLTEYTYFESDWQGKKRLGYQRKEDVEKLFAGLTHFENGKAEVNKDLQEIINKLGNEAILEKIDLHMNKVESIRFYKNGKVDLYFKTSQDALNFAKGYLSLSVAA